MESSKLIRDYLLKRSALETVLPYERFEAEVKKVTGKASSPILLKKLYHELTSQRNQALDSVQTNIDSQFNLPLKPVADRIDTDYKFSPNSIQTLTSSLKKFESELERQLPVQASTIDSLALGIEKRTDKLNGYTPEEVNTDHIHEVNNELIKLKSYFDLNSKAS